MECPQCRSVVTVAGSDPSSLPTVFFINGLIDVYDILKKVDSNEIACQNCCEAKSISFCHTCSMFICASCTNAHIKMKVFEGHKTVAISEMREGALIQLPTKNQLTSTCQKHKGEMKLYCFKCEQLICRDCTLVDHAGHNFNFMNDVADAFRKEVLSSLVPLQETHASVTTAIARVESREKEIRDQGMDIATTITKSFQDLHSILDNHEQVLLKKAQEVMKNKLCILDSQKEDFHLVLTTLNSLMVFVERTAENASDEEFISMKQMVISRVQEISQKYKCLELAPAEVANIGRVMPQADSFHELCQKQSAVYISVVDASKCQISGPGLKYAITKQVANFTINTNDTHGQPPPVQQHVSAELKSLVDGSVLHATVVSQTPSMYKLSYTPTTRGRHQLTVRVNDTEVGTFQVFVQHPPTQLGTPVRVIEGVKPYYIAVGDKGELFVTERSDRQYTELDAQGQKVPLEGKSPFCNERPTGIATDGEGNTYVASDDHKVQKFNRHGEVIKSVGKWGRNIGEFHWPWGVRYHNHQVYVCDRNNGRVQVFDSNLNFVQSISPSGTSRFKKPLKDVDFDNQGNIYVLDENKGQALVFSEDGQYLRCFGHRGEGKGELLRPFGLCVNEDYIYITENVNNRVSVFHTSGEFVHSFGKEGSGSGELQYPFGIAIDQDGFVFVCDTGNNRIQVF